MEEAKKEMEKKVTGLENQVKELETNINNLYNDIEGVYSAHEKGQKEKGDLEQEVKHLKDKITQ